MKSYTIHLLRHGICEGNLVGRYIGRTESPIAMAGIKSLIDLKVAYKYPTALAYYASPSTRCVDSLKILYPQADPTVILEMAECDFGDWENKTAADLKDDPTFLRWMQGEKGVAPPNGESTVVFMQRVCSGFEMLVKNLLFSGTTSAILCTHAGVIMTILSAYGLPKAKMTDWMCDSGFGYSVRIDPSLWSRSQVMEVFATTPITKEAKEQPDHTMVDLARLAADKAYGDLPKEDL